MRLYASGLISGLATITALVACIEYQQNFNVTNPLLYWLGQSILGGILLIAIIIAFLNWHNNSPVSKIQFLLSVVTYLLMYAIAYTGSTYAFVLILVVGIPECYLTRRRFGLIN